jgi:starch synthase
VEKPLKILHVSSECASLIATGGLADVLQALPKALHRMGHDVRIAIPCYQSIPLEHRGQQCCGVEADLRLKRVHGALRETTLPGTDIPVYLVEHEGYFGREHPYGHRSSEYGDNAERFSFFCLGVLDGIPKTGWVPDIVHCHDWQAAPLIAFLKTRSGPQAAWGGVRTFFTIHNLAYQGRYGREQFHFTGLDPSLYHQDCLEHHGDINFMKLGISMADKLTTVSPRYAREIQTHDYGEGLDGMLRKRAADLTGILNGIDYSVWSPKVDTYIARKYSAEDLSGKVACKLDLQRTMNLPEVDVPVFSVVSRLFWQKGIDLIVEALERLMQFELQLVVLGTGEPELENRLLGAAQRYPQKLGLALKFDVGLSHKIQAGSDFFLMPSRYEPCGLTQMYSLAYGSIPIVRRTGGLADSVRDINKVNLRRGTANGISFVPRSSAAVIRSVQRALELYFERDLLDRLRAQGMQEDFSWDRSSRAYAALYEKALERGA